jgi:hypothetical protein
VSILLAGALALLHGLTVLAQPPVPQYPPSPPIYTVLCQPWAVATRDGCQWKKEK